MLADTSAWIEWLRGTGSTPVLLLAAVFAPGDIVAFAGVVAQEVLQGARDDRAAAVYRRCRGRARGARNRELFDRSAGARTRPACPGMDRDFTTIGEMCGLRLVTG
jgi:hypothetical protein